MNSSSLDLRFSKSVLIRLLGRSCLKTALQDIVKNLYSLDKLLAQLSNDGLIKIDQKAFGKNIQEISLTPKGRQVAEQLRKAEEIAKGEITEEGAQFKMPPDWRDRFKGLSAMTHLNVLDDHVAIQEIDQSGKTTSVIMVYVKRINSHFELWCEKDESKECKHVDFAWSLPHMRSLIEEYIKEGKINEGDELK
ncbi:MAG: hypothetical protein M1431_03950 [Candidatus Thermoplasmatota archaeon]|nr:hypothetical protein [Candidatus Thermoplasmatota archaeon]